MYPIQFAYKISGYSIDVFNPDEITPEEFHKFANMNTHLYISVAYDSKSVALDYSMLITDHTEIATATTWEETAINLTEALVVGHIVDMPGYQAGTKFPKNQLITWDAMNCLKTFDITYGSYINGMHSNYAYRWKLHDLRISIQDAANPAPNLSNILPIVNGVVCKPIVVDDVLYAVNGARLCWHTQTHFTPEIQLLDFNNIAEFKIHNLAINTIAKEDEFLVEYEFETGVDWIFTSPQSLNAYTPIVVLNGHLVLPDQIKILDEFHFTINIDSLPLNKISGYRAYMESRVNGKAEIAYTSEDINTLLTYPENNFVVMLKTEKLYIKHLYLDVWNNDMTVNLRDVEGILAHHGSGTIRCFHVERLNDLSTLTIQNSIPIYLTDTLAHIEQTAVVEPEYQNHDLDNAQASQCSMIYVMR